MTNKIKKSIIKIAGALSLRKIFIAVVAKAAGVMRALCKDCTDFVNLVGLRLTPTAHAAKGNVMKKSMFGRFAALIGAVALVALLAACGGGGGGGTSTPVTPGTPAPTASVESITPANGATGVALDQAVEVKIAATNATSISSSTVTVVCAGGVGIPGTVVVATTTTGFKATLTPSVSADPFVSCTGRGTVTVAGPGGTAQVAVNATYTTDKLRYTDKAWLTWTNGAIFVTTKTTVTQASNSTSYQTGAIPLGNCGLGSTAAGAAYILPSGETIADCTDVGAVHRTVRLNPITGVLKDFTGTVPSDVVFTRAEAINTPFGVGTAAQVSDGWYHLGANSSQLHFQPADAAGTFNGADTVIKDGTFADGTIGVTRAGNSN